MSATARLGHRGEVMSGHGDVVRTVAAARITRRLLMAAVAALCVIGAVTAGPAFAGTTAASTFTKTGSDPSTGSTATATSTTGTANAGDTLSWVLHYQNNTGSPATVNITDPIGPNQTFVSGSLQTAPSLAPEWSVDGGASFVTSEPGSGVNAVGAAGLVPPTGLGSVGSFSQITTSATPDTGTGDGWQAIFYGGNVYVLHHHFYPGEIDPSGKTMTLLDCFSVATGAECPGYGAGGVYANSTAGSPFSTNIATDNFTTTAHNWSDLDQSTGKLYFATTLTNSTAYGVGCLDLATNTSCGFFQEGTGAWVNSGTPNPETGSMAGGQTINGKYYTINNSGAVLCYDEATNTSCGSISTGSGPIGGAGFPADISVSTASQVRAFDSRYLFTFEETYTGGPTTGSISCVDLTTNAKCPGFPKSLATTSQSTYLLPVMDTSGAVTGVCYGHDNPAVMTCYSTTGTSIANPYPIPAGDTLGDGSGGTNAVIGSKVYYDVYNSSSAPQTMQYQCYDFATGAACAGFNSPVQPGLSYRPYTISPDPYIPGCLAEDGDAGVVQYFSAITGAIGCSGEVARVPVNPSASYCDGQSGHVTGWNQIQLSGITASQYAGATYTVLDANGNPVPGFDNILLTPGQTTVDISSIPATGSTAKLTIEMTLANPIGGAPKLSVTFTGDPIQVCFKTTVGKAKCSADQSISNEGNALTIGDNGVGDGPAGNDSGQATFFLPANPTMSGCEADLSINKKPDGTTVSPGGQVMYTLLVKNNGPETATQATVSDDIPAGLTVVSAIPAQGTCSIAGAIDCSLGTILSGGSMQILVTANVTATSGTISNCATTSAFQTDPNPDNNSSCTTIHVVPPPPAPPRVDVQVVKHVNHPVAKFGEVLTYTLNVTNNGPDTAPDVKITDTSAIGMHVLSIKPSQGTCTKATPFTCDLGSMAAGKTAKIRIRAIPMQSGTEINTVSTTPGCTSAGVCPKDTDPKNNVSHARTTVKPYIKLVKTVNRHVVHVGQNVVYHLTVSDPTPAAVRHVTVCDPIPAGLVYVSSSPRAHLNTGRYCWTIARLGAHRSRSFTITANAGPGAHGRLVNVASARAPGVPTVHARATVRVIVPPPPVCGSASDEKASLAEASHRKPIAHMAC
jgi:uncharacterized repeat protein (TIGR01451 family)